MTSACYECQLPEPLDENTLHAGHVLCLACAEICTCGQEVSIVPPETVPAVVVTPRGSLTIDVIEEAGGWRVVRFWPELHLIPDDLLTVDHGVVTGVAALADEFVFEVDFGEFVDGAEVDALVALWGKRFKCEKITALSLCISSPVLEDLHFVDLHPSVEHAELLRIPGARLDLVTLARESFPKL